MLDYLNGKKTVIGSLLSQVALWGPKILCPGGVCDPPWLDILFQVIAIAASTLTGVGVVHKQRKGELSRGN